MPQRQRIPADLTRFFGREAELARVSALIDDGARLVTITGLGGFGKSRLSREVARRLVATERWAGCVAYCDPSESRGVDDLNAAVASTLGLALDGGQTDRDSVTALSAQLRQFGRLTLVLDGLDRAQGPAKQMIARWLTDTDALVIIATSRERLGIAGEHTCPLGPLTLPDSATGSDCAAAQALFIDRMRAVGPALDPSPESLDAVAELVTRLDGNPLAIELAAARASLMSPRQLLAHMAKRYQLDAASPVIVEPALVTMIATTWEGLTPPERLALCQLSVFATSASLEAADAVISEAVGADEGAGIPLLQRLMDRSLVTTMESPWLAAVRRVTLPETIQAFARSRMAAGDVDGSQCYDRHARWVEQQVASLEREILGVNSRDARHRACAEVGNALAVVERGMDIAASPESSARGLAVLMSVRRVLSMTRPAAQVIDYFERAWHRSESLAPGIHARIGAQLCRVATWAWPSAKVEAVYRAAVAAGQACGDPTTLAEVLVTAGGQGHVFTNEETEARLAQACRLLADETSPLAVWAFTEHGISLSVAGRIDASLAAFAAARTMAERLDAPLLRSMVNNNQGVALSFVGAWDEAEARYHDALIAARAAAAIEHECAALRNLGECALVRVAFAEARPLLTEAIRLGESVGLDRIVAASILMRASIDHAMGDVATANAGYRAALTCLERVHGDFAAQALASVGLACGLVETGALAEGKRLLLEADGYFKEIGDPVLDQAQVILTDYIAGVTGDRDASTVHDAIQGHFARAEALAVDDPPPHRLPFVRMALLITTRGGIPAEAALPLQVSRSGPGRPQAASEVLYIAADGSGFGHADGAWVSMGRKANARRLLALLAGHRVDAPGTHVTLEDVFEATWPGQRVDEPHRSNRVYVVVTQLRNAGLGALLQHNGDGYLLSTARDVRLADATEFAARARQGAALPP